MIPNTPDQARRYRACDAYVHANQKGTGSACRFELHPAHGEKSGSIFLQIAMQNTIGNIVGHEFPTFDWANKIVVKFDRTDLSQILQVLNGMKEAAGDGKGLFHRTTRANTVIKFTHQLEPKPGYFLSISRKTSEGDLKNAWFFFDMNEAFTLKLCLEQSMMYICFGIPEVIERGRGQLQVMSNPPLSVFPTPMQIAAQQPSSPRVIEVPEMPDDEPILKVSGDSF